MKRVLLALILFSAVARPTCAASLTDGILGQFVGNWTISGFTLGKPADTGAEVKPAFGGAFIEMHVQDPTGRSHYEARVFFGEDSKGGLVVHWLDATGGEPSRTLGSGKIAGDHITLYFPYPDGPFRDRLDYDRAHDRWRLLIEMGPKDHPQTFSDWYFARVKAP
jgi:hypothetical protein